MKKFFRTYWPFSLNELKSQLAYRGAFYLFILTSLFGSFISYFLWMAIYGSAEGTTLGNLSWNEMVVYIFMVYVTTSIVSISPKLITVATVVTPITHIIPDNMLSVSEVPIISPSFSGEFTSSYTRIASRPSFIKGIAKATIDAA